MTMETDHNRPTADDPRLGSYLGIAILAVLVLLALGVLGTTYGLMRAQRERRAAEAARAMAVQQRLHAEAEQQRAQATANFLTQVLGSADPQTAPAGRDRALRDALEAASRDAGARLTDSPAVEARVRFALGQAHLNLGEYDHAVEQLSRALTLSRQHLGDDDPGTLEAATVLADALIRQDRFAEAEPLLLDAASRAGRVFGDDSPRVGEIHESLVRLYEAWGKPELALNWRSPSPSTAPNPR
jgi:tetratricopeptide (TPR) repeat protein